MITLVEASEQIRSRKLSPVELTRECLARIERLNPALNAFITVTAEQAMEEAKCAEAEIMAGNLRGPLHGIPAALKDLFDTAGVRTTAASNQYRERVPSQDAEVVRRLKQAGAVILGKLNMHEFAFGMSGVISAFGPTRNPWNPERISGGSSSGAGAAVASGMCVVAMGSDTSGSIRCPSALCGIVGHRPSKGMFSMKGAVPLCTSFDTAGPMTLTVRDLAFAFDALVQSGFTAMLQEEVKQLRIGIAREHFYDDLEADVASRMNEAVELMGTMVAEVREVEVPRDNFRTIFDAEIYEYHEAMAAKTPELYDPRTLYRVQKCADISATDYIREERRLAEFRTDAEKIFDQVDVVITPTCPAVAPKLAEVGALTIADVRPFEMKYLLRNTAPFSSLFWPSLSVPCGFSSAGLPIGMQISARPGGDSMCFRLAHAYEQAMGWGKRSWQLATSN